MVELSKTGSTFRELRLAAGRTSTAVATALDVKRGTVWRWDKGKRPRWRHMPALAELFDIDRAEAIKRLWGEILDDPCPCGCGAKKSEPKEPAAFNLAFDLACTACGALRKYRRG